MTKPPTRARIIRKSPKPSANTWKTLGGHLKSGQWWSPQNRPMRTQSGQAIVLPCRDRFGKVESSIRWETAGDTQGGGAPLVGGAAARGVPALFAGAARDAAWGEPARPGFSPEGETGKREIKPLAPQADSGFHAALAGIALVRQLRGPHLRT